MHLICGLGNPGGKYAGNRHNIGFMCADALLARWEEDKHASVTPFREKFRGLFTKVEYKDHAVVLLKPHTYMNLSGESVQAAMSFFKIPVSNVVVVHDELDIALGELRVKVGGGSAGHNGLKSITQHATAEYIRIRLGIGRPSGMPTHSWVLSDFSADERIAVDAVLDRSCRALETLLKSGPLVSMNRFNTKAKKKAKQAKSPKVKANPDAPSPGAAPETDRGAISVDDAEESC